jgi:endonuclease/exonuclease/phosphatase family metal-dependent hydrolase
MKRNSLLLWSIIFNLLSLFSLSAQQMKKQPIETTSHQLKILSWNIYMLPYLSLFNRNGHRAEIIGNQLMDSDYQIIVFQEAFSSKCRNILRKKLIEKYPYQYGPANATLWPFKTNSGLWILSTIPLKELKQIRFHTATGFDRIARKGAVLFEGIYNNMNFQLLATHLQSESPTKIAAAQCAEIAGLLKEFYTPDKPQLICGDFNTEMSDTKNYRRMLKTLDADNGELDGKLKVTYDEENNTLAKRTNGKGEIIDYILTRNTHLIDHIKRNVIEFYHSELEYHSHLSDHYAMEATVRFAPVNAYQMIPANQNSLETNIPRKAEASTFYH